MAFGRIAIQTEDGHLEEYELTKPTTSVGRQPGNDIVLNTSAVSRYHAQLDVAEGGVYLVDLGTVNGTFVNDVQVDPNGRVLLNHDDVITLGDVALRFMAPEARSGTKRAMVSLTPEARTIEAPGVPFRMVLDEPQQSVAPGARLQLTLGVENLGDQQIGLNIEMGGLEPDWIKVNRREAALEPGEQIQAMISVRPPRSSHTRPGVYALTVRVMHAPDPSQVLEAVREIDVVPYAGLGIAMQRSRSGDQFHIAVQNQGNVTTQVVLEGYQRQRLLRYRFQPRQLALQPGETKQVTLSVQPAAGRPFGSPQDVTFAVVACSQDEAGFQAPVVARYTITPSWPRWLLGISLPMLLGALLVVALLVGALILTGIIDLPGGMLPVAQSSPTVEAATEVATDASPGLVPTVIPTGIAAIKTFGASPETVYYHTRGEIMLTWEAAGKVELLGPESPPSEIPLTEEDQRNRTYIINQEMLSLGDNTYTLRVTGEDGQVDQEIVTIHVEPYECQLVTGSSIYRDPEQVSPPAPDSLGFAGSLAVVGRNADASWIQIDFRNPENPDYLGWVPPESLRCDTFIAWDSFIEIKSESLVPLPALPTAEPTRGDTGG